MNARTEPADLAYIPANYSPSSGMVGVVMICIYASQWLPSEDVTEFAGRWLYDRKL